MFALVLLLVPFLMVSQAFGQVPVGAGPMVPQLLTVPTPSSPSVASPSMTQPTPAQANQILQRLTPDQQAAAQAELTKTGGTVTPATIDALKSRPEFKNLSPEEIARGKELLEGKDKAEPAKKAIERKEPVWEQERTVIGEESPGDSLFDRYRKIGSYQGISTALKPFGFDFFRDAAVKVLTERKDIPVPADYVVGPGDEVKILMWGRVNAQYNPIIDRNGNISIPQMPPFHVAGMTFQQMAGYLIKQSEQIVGGNIDVTMGALRSIPVFILGDVKRPGAYTIGSFSTITDALLLAGGPSDIGSMRNVQLRRRDRVISIFDLYDLLIKGDKSKDATLQAGDIVFVPVAGTLVGIAGNVKRPAIYELKERSDLSYLFDLAGGIIPTAYTQQIQVERVQKNERQIIVDIDDKHLSKTREFALYDGDLVKVFPIVDKDVNVVFLNGNVKRPGKYEYKTGMRMLDLIKDANDLLQETHFDYALIKRLTLPEMKTELIPFHLGKCLLKKDESNNIVLKPQDQVFIFSSALFRDKPVIQVEGEVRKGGAFDLHERMTARDAVLQAGGLTKNAYLAEAQIFRTDPLTKKSDMLKFDLKSAMEGDPGANLVLQDQDRVVVQSILGYEYAKTVTVDGAVAKPGTYTYARNMTVKDLVFSAGNVLESAYLESAELSSRVIESGKTVTTVHRKINLRNALNGVPEDNVQLQPYDHLFIKPMTDWGKDRYANISGEVRFSGRYILSKGERLSSLIERSGGFKETAYPRGAVFTRISVREMQRKNIEEMIMRLERELLIGGSTGAAAALTPEAVEAKKIELQQKKAFLDSLRTMQATGRMTIRLAHVRLMRGSEYDIELEDGDLLHVPMRPSSVNVMGAVMSNSSFVYAGKATYKDYIEMAGGFSEYADEDKVYVLKADGSAKKLSRGWINWSDSRSRWEAAGFETESRGMEPGDTIIVPEKLDRVVWLREIKDITQILMQMAVVAGVVINMF